MICVHASWCCIVQALSLAGNPAFFRILLSTTVTVWSCAGSNPCYLGMRFSCNPGLILRWADFGDFILLARYLVIWSAVTPYKFVVPQKFILCETIQTDWQSTQVGNVKADRITHWRWFTLSSLSCSTSRVRSYFIHCFCFYLGLFCNPDTRVTHAAEIPFVFGLNFGELHSLCVPIIFLDIVHVFDSWVLFFCVGGIFEVYVFDVLGHAEISSLGKSGQNIYMWHVACDWSTSRVRWDSPNRKYE